MDWFMIKCIIGTIVVLGMLVWYIVGWVGFLVHEYEVRPITMGAFLSSFLFAFAGPMMQIIGERMVNEIHRGARLVKPVSNSKILDIIIVSKETPH